MAPIPLKRSASSAQSLTRGGAPEACGLVREAVRASAAASLPSPPLVPTRPQPQPQKQTDRVQAEVRFGPPVEGLALDAAPAPGVLCWEEIDGRRWSYVVDVDGTPGRARRGSSVRAVPMQSPVAPLEELMSFVRSYVVPEGFPDSVTPSYVPYMTWRALKDGAGRVGKMLFARQGKKFDYDLKQLRFAGDLLMELGAGVELATATVPHLFLPLACAANVVKNVAAVTSTSTRTPIYKAYARGENIGDVTAKGECVGNIADLLGTGLSILISKRNPSLVASFAFLSCGYVFSAYQEVKSVVLNTLNRARFTVAVESFIKTGHVPSLKEGNSKESIFRPPWSKHTPVVIGPRFCDAFQESSSFFAIQPLFEKERYMVTYNPSKDKIYALLKDQAKSDDILKAAFHAHVLLYFIRLSSSNQALRKLMNSNQSTYGVPLLPTNADFLAHMEESCKIVSSSYAIFKRKAAEQGWIMSESLLNPGRARLLSTKEL
ncbi:protein root UVB sensitive 6-like isoform X2 [Musa acuminata AAA Group]|uniref:protein root UVB sensitive 6-like isoform X2 n=1 Tax=Musa acuminata AAA Group TaxID=214697 RepID=UPI0008A0A050|nr:PREDICTED: protein root UVB sensitive 6-like isoform X2 [Musa acuminata subsp. malaccensis]